MKPGRFTLASLYLTAGLAAGFIILTQAVPAMYIIMDQAAREKIHSGFDESAAGSSRRSPVMVNWPLAPKGDTIDPVTAFP